MDTFSINSETKQVMQIDSEILWINKNILPSLLLEVKSSSCVDDPDPA